jgi:RNA polymerase-binding transcription factor DksA
VGGSPLTVVGHNGIMPARLQPLKGDPRSDTAIFAEHDLPGRNLDRERNRNRLAKFLGRGNKIVVLTVDTSYKNSAYVINEQYGKWDNGAWYSNDGYLPYVPYSSYGGWSGEWEHSTTCRCWECDGGEYPGDYKGARHYDWARYVAHCMAELVKLGQDEMNLKPWEVLQAFSEDETILLANHVRASLEKARAEQAEKSCATGDVLFCRVCGETSPPTPLFSCPTCQHCFECKRDVETACECWTHSTETVDST